MTVPPKGITNNGKGYRFRRKKWGRTVDITVATRAEAVTIAHDFEKAVEAGRGAKVLPALRYEIAEHEALTASEVAWETEIFNGWLAEIRGTKKVRTVTDYKSQILGYVAWVAKGLRKDPGAMRVDEVFSRKLVMGYYSHRLKTVAPTSAYKSYTAIVCYWRWASENDDTYHGVPRVRAPSVPRPQPPSRPSPSLAELDALLRVMPDNVVRKGCILARFTGLRFGSQVAPLRWDEVDLDRAEIRISARTAKTASEGMGRCIPIHAELLAHMQEWRAANPDGELVFPVKSDRGFIGPQYATIAVRKSLKKLSTTEMRPLVWDRCNGTYTGRRTTHLFRAGYQTALRSNGVDSDVIRALVGHSRGIQGGYVSSDTLPLREAVATLPGIDWDGPGDLPENVTRATFG